MRHPKSIAARATAEFPGAEFERVLRRGSRPLATMPQPLCVAFGSKRVRVRAHRPFQGFRAMAIIHRMCAPQRSERYATLAEALNDLAICEI